MVKKQIWLLLSLWLLLSALLCGCGTAEPTSGAASTGILTSEAVSPEEPSESSEGFSTSGCSSPSERAVSEEPIPVYDYTGLRINELLVRATLYKDENGKQSDWIELFNGRAEALPLDGLTLSTGKKLTGEIAPGAYLVLYTPLPKSGEVSLLDGENCIDRVELPVEGELGKDFSFARGGVQNGGDYRAAGELDFVVTSLATPGFPNDAAGLEDYFAAADRAEALVIREVVTSNVDEKLTAPDGERYDWVLLENRGDGELFLADYRLSDGGDFDGAALLPEKTLAPGKTVRLFCTGDAETGLPFKLSDDGERLLLYGKDGELCDGCLLFAIPTGGSYGRMDGKDGFFYFPKAGKAAGGCRAVTSTPVPSVAPGLYPSAERVSFAGEGVIRYTLNGSKPGKGAKEYTEEIPVEKNLSIRYVAEAEGKLPCETVTAAYLIGETTALPVAYLSLSPDDMWSKSTGIYNDANRWSRMEREANLSIFDETTGNCSVNCGLSLSGAGSRELEKRSLQMKFRSIYGDGKLRYDLFGDGVTEFDSVKLRVGEDYQNSIFRDELITSLAGKNTAVRYQKYRFCLLFVNGEYFGIFCFRDKLDEQYVARMENLPVSKVEALLEYDDKLNYGDNSDWKTLVRFISGNDMRKAENYAVVKEQVYIESLIDWTIAELYAGNRDYANERKYKCEGGKWTWILYDMDWSFYHHSGSYTIIKNTGSHETGGLVRSLLRNAEFRDLFLTRLSMTLRNIYTYENIVAGCDALSALLADEVPRNCRRWGGNADAWADRVNDIKKFTEKRQNELIKETIAYFSLTEQEQARYGWSR